MEVDPTFEEVQVLYSKIFGVSFDNRQQYAAAMNPGDTVYAVREADNVFDENAIALYDADRNQLGYIGKILSATLAPQMDKGAVLNIKVEQVTGGGDVNYGVNVRIQVLRLKSIQNMEHRSSELLQAPKDMTYMEYPVGLLIHLHYSDFIQSDSILDREAGAVSAALQDAIAEGRAAMALALLWLQPDSNALFKMMYLYKDIGAWEYAYYLAVHLYSLQNFCESVRVNQVLKELEGWHVPEVLRELGDSFIRKKDLQVEQSMEDGSENYPESLEALQFIQKFSYRRAAKTKLDRMQNSMYPDEQIKGFAYAAEAEFESDAYELAAHDYMEAAKRQRNCALYYAYAGNAFWKDVCYNPPERTRKKLTYALILNHRAIELDFQNPRWHLYQGLILEAAWSMLSAERGTKHICQNYLAGAADELELAKNFVSDKTENLQRGIHNAMQIHQMMLGYRPELSLA